METWEAEALEDVYREVKPENPLINAGVKYVEFVSRSNGKNKKKRKRAREVRLVSYGNKTVAIGNRLSKRLEFFMQDIYPEHRALDSADDWLTSFVNALKEANRLAKK